MSLPNLIGEIISILNSRAISVIWLHPGHTRNFVHNTNIKTQDEHGNDLEFKSAEDICNEMAHCGDEIICMLYTRSNTTKEEQTLFFDSWD